MRFTFIAFHATLLKSDVGIFTLIQGGSVNTNELKECKHFMLIYLVYSSVIKSSNSTQLRIKPTGHIVLLCASLFIYIHHCLCCLFHVVSQVLHLDYFPSCGSTLFKSR